MKGFNHEAASECRADFESVCDFYSPYKHLQDFSVSRQLLAKAHRFATSLSHLTKEAEGRVEHRRIFLQEACSDSVHLVHSLFTGDARAAYFYIRSVVENIWRHIFFRDHPVEYAWIHERDGFYLTIEQIREFCKNTRFAKSFLSESMGNMSSAFSKMSGYVHSTSAASVVLRETLSDIKLSESQSSEIAGSINVLAKDVILMVTVYESELFEAMNSSRRAFCLDMLDTKRKAARQSSLG